MNAVFSDDPIAFVDLETTGANLTTDRIIEIGIVLLDKEGVREWSSLVNPDQPIPPFISKLTGIHPEMVSDAPSFEQLAPVIRKLLEGRLFVAHNARFDYTFLKREFRQLGQVFRAQSLCTVKLSRKLFPGHHRHSLDTLIARHAIEVDERHRALADARVLCTLWQLWKNEHSDGGFSTTVAELVGHPVLPPQIDPRQLEDVPEAPGAYAFHDADGKLMLCKRAGNLRQQVLAHFSEKNRETVLVRDVYRIDWRETAGEFGARLAELFLSRSSTQAHEEPCAWRLVERSAGDFRPELVYSSDADFGVTPFLFGLYAHKKEAINALRRITDAHRLCHALLGLGVNKPGEPCVGFKQRTCRGACVGKEPLSMHGVRLMTALAKYKLTEWPYPGPVVLLERDEYGMREDYHLVDRWRHFGVTQDPSKLPEMLASASEVRFDADVYRILKRFLSTGKIRILPPPSVDQSE